MVGAREVATTAVAVHCHPGEYPPTPSVRLCVCVCDCVCLVVGVCVVVCVWLCVCVGAQTVLGKGKQQRCWAETRWVGHGARSETGMMARERTLLVPQAPIAPLLLGRSPRPRARRR